MSLKDWVPLARYDASDPISLLSFLERAAEAELHRIADDAGRILVGDREPWEVVARTGASVGDRRLLRKILPTLFEAGLLKRDGAYMVLTRRPIFDAAGQKREGGHRGRGAREGERDGRDGERDRREGDASGREPGASRRESGASGHESGAKDDVSARDDSGASRTHAGARAGGDQEEKRSEDKRVDPPPQPPGGGPGEGGPNGPETRRSERRADPDGAPAAAPPGTPSGFAPEEAREAPIVQQVLAQLRAGGEATARLATVAFARQLAAFSAEDGYTGPHRGDVLLARVRKGVEAVAARVNTGEVVGSPAALVMSKIHESGAAAPTIHSISAAEGAERFRKFFAAAWAKHRKGTYAAGPRDGELSMQVWEQARENARRAAADAAEGKWSPEEEDILRWWVQAFFAKETRFLVEENWSMKCFLSQIGGFGLPKAQQPRHPTSSSRSTLAHIDPQGVDPARMRSLVSAIGGGAQPPAPEAAEAGGAR